MPLDQRILGYGRRRPLASANRFADQAMLA
jgi:hypothetical protein